MSFQPVEDNGTIVPLSGRDRTVASAPLGDEPLLPVLIVLFALALLPPWPLIFDASTRSMEPKSSAAGYALAQIMQRMPTRWEPVLGVVRAPNEMASSLAAARREARNAFGDDAVYVEKFVEGPRHVEIQILGDTHGAMLHLGVGQPRTERRQQGEQCHHGSQIQTDTSMHGNPRDSS